MLTEITRPEHTTETHRDTKVRIRMVLGARGRAPELSSEDEGLSWPSSLGWSESRGVVSKEARGDPDGDRRSSAICDAGLNKKIWRRLCLDRFRSRYLVVVEMERAIRALAHFYLHDLPNDK